VAAEAVQDVLGSNEHRGLGLDGSGSSLLPPFEGGAEAPNLAARRCYRAFRPERRPGRCAILEVLDHLRRLEVDEPICASRRELPLNLFVNGNRRNASESRERCASYESRDFRGDCAGFS
jgi:hypothetical protein